MLRYLVGLIAIFASILIGSMTVLLEKNWIDLSALDSYKVSKPSIVFDDTGDVLCKFELDRRPPVPYRQLPDGVVKAFIAAEDHNFFNHAGISLRGIVRSFLVNVYHRRVVQGASTITQQLARLMFLSHERTWYRKIREIFLAFQLEHQLSKEQILELYLNNVYFGHGIYGIDAASRRIWNKSFDQLTIDEAATLAATAASARKYSPLNSLTNAQRRRNIILRSMQKLGFITTEEFDAAIKVQLSTNQYINGNPIRLYLQEWLRNWAENKWGKDILYNGGLKIKTTINKDMQEKAEKIFNQKIQQLRQRMGPSLNGGMMSITPETGAIKIMIGGYDFKQSQFNRAFQAIRQMGSSFKPLLYALAVKAGVTMDSVFVDEPFQMKMPSGQLWEPVNWYNQFKGAMTLAQALTISCNIIAIKLFLKIGPAYVVPWARQFGISRNLNEYPSSALGTAEVTVEENVAAFNVFANNGVYVKPYMIEWVKDEYGNKLWETTTYKYRILDSIINSKMVNALSQRMILAKRQSPNDWIDAEAIGKSGSTNGAATTWFVGATPTLTTAIYVGRDDNKPMGNQLLASRTTFPIWADFYKSLTFLKKHFYKDPSLREYPINWITGQPTTNLNDYKTIVLLQE